MSDAGGRRQLARRHGAAARDAAGPATAPARHSPSIQEWTRNGPQAGHQVRARARLPGAHRDGRRFFARSQVPPRDGAPARRRRVRDRFALRCRRHLRISALAGGLEPGRQRSDAGAAGHPGPRDDHLLPRLSALAARTPGPRRHPGRWLLVLRRVDLPGQPAGPLGGRRRDGGVSDPLRRSPGRQHQDLQARDLERLHHPGPVGGFAPRPVGQARAGRRGFSPAPAAGRSGAVQRLRVPLPGRGVSGLQSWAGDRGVVQLHRHRPRLTRAHRAVPGLRAGLHQPPAPPAAGSFAVRGGRGRDLPGERRRSNPDVQIQPGRDLGSSPQDRSPAGARLVLRNLSADRAGARPRGPRRRAVGLGVFVCAADPADPDHHRQHSGPTGRDEALST